MPPPDAPSDAADRAAQALARLRENVVRAAAEIERLREENERLAERLRTLSQDEALAGAQWSLPDHLGTDPEALRRQIGAFIEALDRTLADDTAAPEALTPED